jgi:hypothetical protein
LVILEMGFCKLFAQGGLWTSVLQILASQGAKITVMSNCYLAKIWFLHYKKVYWLFWKLGDFAEDSSQKSFLKNPTMKKAKYKDNIVNSN